VTCTCFFGHPLECQLHDLPFEHQCVGTAQTAVDDSRVEHGVDGEGGRVHVSQRSDDERHLQAVGRGQLVDGDAVEEAAGVFFKGGLDGGWVMTEDDVQ
jgi:hypothetical protein